MAHHQHQQATKAWVISVNMGYGHLRAAYPLKDLAFKRQVFIANSYPGIPAADRKLWQQSRSGYEFISRFKSVPIIGESAWNMFEKLQQIPTFYPRRDLSKPSLQLKEIYRFIERRQWGRHLIEKLSAQPLPLVTTFFIPAFMAESFDYPGEIYCLTTDTDINRAWVAKNPANSRIRYFAPNYRVVERLQLYGVPKDRIFLTGFPLPKENTGGEKLEVLKQDVIHRLVNLDPERKYLDRHQQTVKRYLSISRLPKKSNHPLTLTFAVGGAGAQRQIGADIVQSLKNKILQKKISVVLVAGIHNNLSAFFRTSVVAAGLRSELGRGVKIIFSPSKDDYFKKFNLALRTTDILWTKPSELSFYTALGLPIVIAPPIGSQEKFNRTWLRTLGAAASQLDPKHCNEWLFDWIDSGWFAEAAMEGFVEAPQFGTFNIEKIVSHRLDETTEFKMLLQY